MQSQSIAKTLSTLTQIHKIAKANSSADVDICRHSLTHIAEIAESLLDQSKTKTEDTPCNF